MAGASPRHVAESHGRSTRRDAPIHPLAIRIGHWVNAVAMIVMIGSGWAIHNADPIAPFSFPAGITIGDGLAGALRWHFAAMWILAANGAFYLIYASLSGRFLRKLMPIRIAALRSDLGAALRGRLGHADPARYNAVQKLLYVGVILAACLAVVSGVAIWKPVQFGLLTRLLGDFDSARLVHFAAMTAIVLFLLVHVGMALLVPASLRAMLRGR